jgi:PEP-CTERM motif-containing protein
VKRFGSFALIAVIALGVATLPAMAGTAFSDLGNPPNYDCCVGWTVGGANSPVGLIEDANQFTAGVSGMVNQIDLGLGLVVGSNSATIQLWTSVNNLPGTMLGSVNVTGLPNFGSTSTQLVTGLGNFGSITAGQQYFVVVLAASDAWEAWNLNTQGANGLLLQNSGNGWNQFFGSQLGAFDVLTGGGGSVPEPASLMLLGSGFLAVASRLRRKK